MKLQAAVLAALVLAAVAIASAAEPVAVRVDVEPVSFGGDGTRVAVTVQVAPEDRGRIGRNAMVRIELDGAPPPGQSPLWALRMADDGSGRIDTVWPPGEHTLRLEISDPSGQDSGLWVGTVRIPGIVEGRGAAASSEPPAAPPDAPADVDEPPAEVAETAVDTGDPRTAGAAGPTEAAVAEPDAAAASAGPGTAAAAPAVAADSGSLEAPPQGGEAAAKATEAAAGPVRELVEAPAETAAAAPAGTAAAAAESHDAPGRARSDEGVVGGSERAAGDPGAPEPPLTVVATEAAAAPSPAAEPAAVLPAAETVEGAAPRPAGEEPTPVAPPPEAGETEVTEAQRLDETPPSPVIEEVPEPGDAVAPAPEAEPATAPVTAEQEAPAAAPELPVSESAVDVPAPDAAAASEPVIEPQTVVVEPLRPAGAPPAPTSATEPPPKAERGTGPPAAELAAAYAAWRSADPATSELTAVVLRGREPAGDVTPSNLELRLAGRQVVIDAVGDSGRAPLLLGIAVDAAGDAGIGWPGAGGRLAALADRAAAGRGRTFYSAPGVGVGDWDAGPPAAAPSNSSGDVAELIVDSLARFEGTRGRRVLLLITDGRSDPDKNAWQRAVDAAAASGTPVLIVALWDEDFGRRARNNLREVVDASGGSLFLVQGRPQLDRAVERFGPLLDAAVSVRFTVPTGVELPADVRLDSAAPELEVSAPRRVR